MTQKEVTKTYRKVEANGLSAGKLTTVFVP